MSGLCGCRRVQKPTPLDTPFDFTANLLVNAPKGKEIGMRVLAYSVQTFRGANFDFVPVDNGSHYIAKFRAAGNGEIMGRDSFPIPKDIFEKLHIIRKQRRGTVYCIDLNTGGEPLVPYFATADLEGVEMDEKLERMQAESRKL